MMEAAASKAHESESRQPERGRLSAVLAGIARSVEGKVGLVLITSYLVLVALGPSLAPYAPDAIGAGPLSSAPSVEHPLGTDSLGRDVLSRLLHGARSVMVLPLLATCLAFCAGAAIGIVSAYVGGKVDWAISRMIEILLALPPLIVVLVVIAALGSAPPVLVASIALIFMPRIARVLRGAALAIVPNEYVQAAQARGERVGAVVAREIFPNLLPTALVEFAIRLTFAIIAFATLNFFGFGAQPPASNWGLMVFESRTTLGVNPTATLAPALAIGLLSIGVSFVADAVTRHHAVGAGFEVGR